MKKLFITIFAILIAGTILAACTGPDSESNAGRQIHVAADGSDETGDGSEEAPYATPAFAVSQISPGTEVIVHEGTYGQFEIDEAASGTEADPVVIRAAEGEKVVIESAPGDESIGIFLINAGNITLDGFEVTGGTHGIYYGSTPDRGEEALKNITISNCRVHGIRGTHGICVYAENDLAPVRNITLSGCEVHDCECGDSESAVLNGNIDGFKIEGNVIHDNNNIGIDMIGFEGTAKHAGAGGDPYDADFVRNGECYGNVIYNISSDGNEAYREDGGYELCADGIYVDGGQDIKIHDNFVFNCDIGIEVATEHSPEEDELFKVSGIEVYDNVIAGCTGWCGMCFGGYDADLGFTEDCSFRNNTLIDNGTQIAVQRSRGNKIYDNLCVGDCTGLEFNTDVKEDDMLNTFGENIWCFDCEDSFEDRFDAGDYDLGRLVCLDDQRVFFDRSEVLDGFRSLKEGKGSAFVPEEKYVEIYREVCLKEQLQ